MFEKVNANMREILFRAKRIDNGEWVYGYYLQRMNNQGQVIDSFIVVDAYEQIRYGQRHIYSILGKESYRVDHKTAGQFTNRTDKNGKAIFEGDVLSVGRTIFVCYWDDGNLEFALRNDKESIGMAYMTVHYAEVIGNIYDNENLVD